MNFDEHQLVLSTQTKTNRNKHSTQHSPDEVGRVRVHFHALLVGVELQHVRGEVQHLEGAALACARGGKEVKRVWLNTVSDILINILIF